MEGRGVDFLIVDSPRPQKVVVRFRTAKHLAALTLLIVPR